MLRLSLLVLLVATATKAEFECPEDTSGFTRVKLKIFVLSNSVTEKVPFTKFSLTSKYLLLIVWDQIF